VLRHNTGLPEVLRRFLAVTGPTQQPDAPLDAGGGGLPRPLPGNPEVLKVLIEEARAFLNALEPVRNNFRALMRLLGRLKGVEAVPEREAALLRELAASNREKVLNLGPAVYGLMPFVEWDPENARAFLATFGKQDKAPAGDPDNSPETRLGDKLAAVECFAELIQDLYQRLLDRLEGCAGPALPNRTVRAGLTQVAAASAPPGRGRPVSKGKATAARDRWIYRQCCKGTAYKDIIAELQKKKRWNPIHSVQGIRKAAQAYAERKGLPPIPRRQEL
jgi:hypothetical protein